jgi:hypothetical protein
MDASTVIKRANLLKIDIAGGKHSSVCRMLARVGIYSGLQCN